LITHVTLVSTNTCTVDILFDYTGKSSSETCLVCETIVQYLEALLEQNATIADIEAILNKICNFLPDTMRAEV